MAFIDLVPLQLSVGMSVLLGAIFLQALFNPYKRDSTDVIATVVLIQLFVSLFIGLLVYMETGTCGSPLHNGGDGRHSHSLADCLGGLVSQALACLVSTKPRERTFLARCSSTPTCW